jgi:hypothetical protein
VSVPLLEERLIALYLFFSTFDLVPKVFSAFRIQDYRINLFLLFLLPAFALA